MDPQPIPMWHPRAALPPLQTPHPLPQPSAAPIPKPKSTSNAETCASNIIDSKVEPESKESKIALQTPLQTQSHPFGVVYSYPFGFAGYNPQQSMHPPGFIAPQFQMPMQRYMEPPQLKPLAFPCIHTALVADEKPSAMHDSSQLGDILQSKEFMIHTTQKYVEKDFGSEGPKKKSVSFAASVVEPSSNKPKRVAKANSLTDDASQDGTTSRSTSRSRRRTFKERSIELFIQVAGILLCVPCLDYNEQSNSQVRRNIT